MRAFTFVVTKRYRNRVFLNWQVGFAGRGTSRVRLQGRMVLVSRQTSVVGKEAKDRTGWKKVTIRERNPVLLAFKQMS